MAESVDQEILQAPVGKLARERLIDAQWAGEHTALAAWVVQRGPLPPAWSYADGTTAAKSLGFLEPAGSEALRSATVRDRGEIAAYHLHVATLRWATQELRLAKVGRLDDRGKHATRLLLDERLSRVGLAASEADLEAAQRKAGEAEHLLTRGSPGLGINLVREMCLEWILGGRESFWEA